MAVLHLSLSLGSLNIHLHVPRQVSIKSMEHVLIALQFEEHLNFTLWMPPALDVRGRRLVAQILCTPLFVELMYLLHDPDSKVGFGQHHDCRSILERMQCDHCALKEIANSSKFPKHGRKGIQLTHYVQLYLIFSIETLNKEWVEKLLERLSCLCCRASEEVRHISNPWQCQGNLIFSPIRNHVNDFIKNFENFEDEHKTQFSDLICTNSKLAKLSNIGQVMASLKQMKTMQNRYFLFFNKLVHVLTEFGVTKPAWQYRCFPWKIEFMSFVVLMKAT